MHWTSGLLQNDNSKQARGVVCGEKKVLRTLPGFRLCFSRSGLEDGRMDRDEELLSSLGGWSGFEIVDFERREGDPSEIWIT